MIIDDCQKAPQASFWQKLKGAWAMVDADAIKKLEQKGKRLPRSGAELDFLFRTEGRQP
jgi:hypothetical protein